MIHIEPITPKVDYLVCVVLQRRWRHAGVIRFLFLIRHIYLISVW